MEPHLTRSPIDGAPVLRRVDPADAAGEAFGFDERDAATERLWQHADPVEDAAPPRTIVDVAVETGIIYVVLVVLVAAGLLIGEWIATLL
jgi:hypothetical protein